MHALFDLIVDGHVPAPPADRRRPVRHAGDDPGGGSTILGRILTGRIHSGTTKLNMPVKALRRDGTADRAARAAHQAAVLPRSEARADRTEAEAGDIVAIAGLSEATVADTICAPEVEAALAAQPIDPPTLAMTFSVNDSPLAGQEGDKVTSRMIRDRLMREAEGNVAIRITETEDKDAFEVAGRGELQLGVS